MRPLALANPRWPVEIVKTWALPHLSNCPHRWTETGGPLDIPGLSPHNRNGCSSPEIAENRGPLIWVAASRNLDMRSDCSYSSSVLYSLLGTRQPMSA